MKRQRPWQRQMPANIDFECLNVRQNVILQAINIIIVVVVVRRTSSVVRRRRCYNTTHSCCYCLSLPQLFLFRFIFVQTHVFALNDLDSGN